MSHNYAKIRFFVDPEESYGESAELLWAERVGSKEGGAFRSANPFVQITGVIRGTEAAEV